MDLVLDDLKRNLVRSGDPTVCLLIADRLEETDEDGSGWRWIGQLGKVPHSTDGMDRWWNEDFEFTDYVPIGPENMLPPEAGLNARNGGTRFHWRQ